MQTYRFPARAVRAVPAVFAILGVMLGASGASGQAQTPAPASQPMYEYAVKFVCGRTAVNPQLPPPVAPGFYFTDINVHNPNSGTVEFRKKFVLALRNQQSKEPTQFFPAALRSDWAFGVDCVEIAMRFGASPLTFITGFVVFQTGRELDIVAVYTSAATQAGTVTTMAVERVPKRP